MRFVELDRVPGSMFFHLGWPPSCAAHHFITSVLGKAGRFYLLGQITIHVLWLEGLASRPQRRWCGSQCLDCAGNRYIPSREGPDFGIDGGECNKLAGRQRSWNGHVCGARNHGITRRCCVNTSIWRSASLRSHQLFDWRVYCLKSTTKFYLLLGDTRETPRTKVEDVSFTNNFRLYAGVILPSGGT